MAWFRTADQHKSEWQRMIDELAAHNGTLEIGLPCAFEPMGPDGHDQDSLDDIPKSWRVRLLSLSGDQWIVERPPIAGRRTGGLITGATLIGNISQKQRKWSFRTSILRTQLFELNARNRVPALRLSPPRDVGSAQRRSFYRVSTVGAQLPAVNIWPLLDAQTCLAAEDRMQLVHLDPEASPNAPLQQPDLGDGFVGSLVDISAGGAALSVEATHAPAFEQHKLFWMELLLPTNDYPLLVAADPVHVHHDRVKKVLQIGMEFKHDHNQTYRRFVQENICRYAAWEQRRQLQRLHGR